MSDCTHTAKSSSGASDRRAAPTPSSTSSVTSVLDPCRRPPADRISGPTGRQHVVDEQVVPVKARLPPGDVVGMQEHGALPSVVRGGVQSASSGALPTGAAPIDGDDDRSVRRTPQQQRGDDVPYRHGLPRPEVRLLREQPHLLSDPLPHAQVFQTDEDRGVDPSDGHRRRGLGRRPVSSLVHASRRRTASRAAPHDRLTPLPPWP